VDTSNERRVEEKKAWLAEKLSKNPKTMASKRTTTIHNP
jgi:hypothetical protein